MNRKKCELSALGLCLLFLTVCSPAEKKSTPTSGSAFIYTSSSVEGLGIELSRIFEGFYPAARIDLSPLPTRAAVESLFFGTPEEIILDRPLVPAESLAAANSGIPVYQYHVATLPLYFAVHPNNSVEVIDSVTLRKFLTGAWRSWREAGGPNIPCHPYVPLPGEGGWDAFMNYFGILDSVSAVVCTTQSDLVEKAESDPGALALVSLPIAKTSLRKLWWRRGKKEILPNIKTIVEEPRYPFKLTITYITNRQKMDVAAGFLTFIMSNAGQKVVADAGYRPATIPVRIIETF